MGALLWSFRGRINRQPYWLASLAIVVVMVVFGGVVGAFAGVGMATSELAAGAGIALLGLALGIPLIWIGLALGAKRLHDRDKSAWWLLVFYLLPSVLQSAGEAAGGMGWILALAGFGISIWGLIELGFLRGTSGSNRFGPDPLVTA